PRYPHFTLDLTEWRSGLRARADRDERLFAGPEGPSRAARHGARRAPAGRARPPTAARAGARPGAPRPSRPAWPRDATRRSTARARGGRAAVRAAGPRQGPA